MRCVVLISALLLSSGCASTSLDVDRLAPEICSRSFFVENHGRDDRRLDELIVRELRARGIKAYGGHRADRPESVDVLVLYDDRWMWDLSTYLLSLRIDLREPDSNVLIGAGLSFQTSLARKSPEKVISIILDGMIPEASY